MYEQPNRNRLIDVHSIYEQTYEIAQLQAEADHKYLDSILSFSIMPEAIVEWYFAQDPTNATRDAALDAAFATDDIDQARQVMTNSVMHEVALGRAGLTMLAYITDPHVFDMAQENGKAWWSYIPGIENIQNDDAAVSTAKLQSRLTDRFLGMLQSGGLRLDLETFDCTLLAAEMLRQSSRNLNFLSNSDLLLATILDETQVQSQISSLRQEGKLQTVPTVLFGIEKDELQAELRKQEIINNSLLSGLASVATYDIGDEDDGNFDPYRMHSLKAKALYASSWMSGNFRASPDGEMYERAKREFTELTGIMRTVFALDKPISGRLKSPDVKGALHEILWFMDAFALRLLEPDKYGNVRAIPSYSREDSPMIGYPEHKRGFDMTLMFGNVCEFLQLKSGAGRRNKMQRNSDIFPDDKSAPDLVGLPPNLPHANNDEYAATILETREQNFMEVNPRRLASKLSAFTAWAESGFDPVAGERVRKYIMESVQYEFEQIIHRPIDRASQVRLAVAENVIGPALKMKDPTIFRQVIRRMARPEEVPTPVKRNSAQSATEEMHKRKARRQQAKRSRRRNR